MDDIELEFLRESNHIEGEFSDDALEDAVAAWKSLKETNVLTGAIVRQTHAILMRRRDTIPEYEKGVYRNIMVYIGNKPAMSAEKVPEAMDNWIKKMNGALKQKNPDHIELHVIYEKIHPFTDGNGRTGRMFLNWTRLKKKQPILVIKNAEKRSYYSWFK